MKRKKEKRKTPVTFRIDKEGISMQGSAEVEEIMNTCFQAGRASFAEQVLIEVQKELVKYGHYPSEKDMSETMIAMKVGEIKRRIKELLKNE